MRPMIMHGFPSLLICYNSYYIQWDTRMIGYASFNHYCSCLTGKRYTTNQLITGTGRSWGARLRVASDYTKIRTHPTCQIDKSICGSGLAGHACFVIAF